MFIYALDPNRHLHADTPFPEFLAHLVRISARPEGLPVPEIGLLQARALCGGNPFSKESGENPFWKGIAEELLACVQERQPAIPTDIPIGIPEDPEEVWRRNIFTYPPGRYAILRCGRELMDAVAANSSSARFRKLKHFQASANPWDRAVARAAIDFKPPHRKYQMSLKTWIRREEIQAKDGGRSALQIAMMAARLVPESRPTNRNKHA